MLYFTSDFHLGHEKILTLGAGRPFATIEAMNEAILTPLRRLTASDTLYMLGDWTCGVGDRKLDVIRATRAQIGAGAVHLIRGNHDPRTSALQALVADGTLASVSEMTTIRVGRTEVVLCHYPLEDWEFEASGTIHLHGHRHGAGTRHATRRRLDVGVDGHGFAPWSFDEVWREMTARPWAAREHHAS